MAIQNEIKIFFRFLKDKKVFKEFFREVKNNKYVHSSLNKIYFGDIKLLFESESSVDFIDKSLHWDDTERGSGFWDNLSKQYIGYFCLVNKGIKEDLLKDE